MTTTTTRTTCPTCGDERNSWSMDETAEMWLEAHDARYHAALAFGAGVTDHLPQDSYGYAVVGRTAKTATLVPLPDPQSLGHEPARFDGPYPVWTHTYTEAETRAAAVNAKIGTIRKATLRKDGRWYLAGATRPLTVNAARYHRNYSY